MFPRQFATRRRFARAMFLAVCLVPTLAIASWGLWRQAPWHAAQIAARVGATLDLSCNIAAVEHVRPGALRLRGLVLRNSETGRLVCECSVVDARRADRRIEIKVSKAEVDVEQRATIWRACERLLRRQIQDGSAMAFTASELQLLSDRASHKLHDLDAIVPGGDDAAALDIRFHSSREPAAAPVNLHLERSRGEHPVTTLLVDSAGQELDCSLLGCGSSAFDGLGPRATFAGRFSVAFDEQVQTELAGKFREVDLGRLAAGYLDQHVEGAAQLDVVHVKCVDSKLETAQARITGGPGVISTALCRSLAVELQMPAARRATQPNGDALVVFEKLDAEFWLERRGIALRGHCNEPGQGPELRSGVVLADAEGPLLAEPESPQTLVALVRGLAAAEVPELPATTAARRLAAALPLERAAAEAIARPPERADSSTRR